VRTKASWVGLICCTYRYQY